MKKVSVAPNGAKTLEANPLVVKELSKANLDAILVVRPND